MGGFPQQPWLFLLKMIVLLGCVFLGGLETHHLRKHPFFPAKKSSRVLVGGPTTEAEGTEKVERLRWRCFFTELVRAVHVRVLSRIVTETDLRWLGGKPVTPSCQVC